MPLEATVLTGRRLECHQTIQLEILRQIIRQTLHLGQDHTKVMWGQIRSGQVKLANGTRPRIGHNLIGFTCFERSNAACIAFEGHKPMSRSWDSQRSVCYVIDLRWPFQVAWGWTWLMVIVSDSQDQLWSPTDASKAVPRMKALEGAKSVVQTILCDVITPDLWWPWLDVAITST